MVFNRRNGIYRSVIVALAGLILLAASNSPPQKGENGQGKQQTQAAPIKAAAPSKATEPAYRPYTDRHADACYNAQDHDTADLCAQWRAAIAAEKAASEASRATTWAIVATILSFVGVGGLIFTIWQTHGALGEARRGNKLTMRANARATRQGLQSATETAKALEISERNAAAAVRLADQTERNGKRQLRAYLSVRSFMLEETEHDDDKFVFSMEIVNNGATPAIIKNLICKVTWAYKGGEYDIVDFDTSIKTKSHKDTPIRIPIFFNGSFEGCEEDGHIIIYGRVDYLDVFEDDQFDIFSFRTEGSDFGRFYDLDMPFRFSAFPIESALESIEKEQARREKKDADKA